MTPSARVQAAIELLLSIENNKRPTDALVSGYFRKHRYIGAKDRAAISALVYDVIRHHARLNWWLTKANVEITPRSRLLAYLALVEGKKANVIGTLFTGKKFAPKILDKTEQKLLKKLEGHTIYHPAMPEAVAVECPDWAEPALRKRFGKSFAKEMIALLEPAPLDLRVNTLKVSREEAFKMLINSGFQAELCKFSPQGIRIHGRPNLTTLPLLREGLVEIQDEGSQLVSLSVNAKPGMRVVDFCAGAGGKTLALAMEMQNKGRIIACDVVHNRLKRSIKRFRRAGVHNVETRLLSSESDLWIKRHKETFDRVLVDVPCSGTGTWRRNPDKKWRTRNQEIKELVNLQVTILSNASRLVKPGGRLIYATCSLLPEENEQQIEKFIAENSRFFTVPAEKTHIINLPKTAYIGSHLVLTTATHGTDGFFVAIIEKSEE